VWSAGLQLERTSLAWRRLALTLLGLALAIPKLGWPVVGSWTIAPAGLVAAGAVTLFAASHRRYLTTHRVLKAGAAGSSRDGRLMMVTVLSAMILAAVAVAIIAAQFT